MWLKGKSALITGAFARHRSRASRSNSQRMEQRRSVSIICRTNPQPTRHFRKFGSWGPTGSSAKRMSPIPPRFRACLNRSSDEFGTLDVMVSNARVELATGFYQSPLEIPLDKFELTFDSQVRAFHVLTRQMVEMLPSAGGGRIIAISYSPSGRTGSWQPWAAMGAAKAALDSLARYYAVALAQRGVTVNIVSPRGYGRQRTERASV